MNPQDCPGTSPSAHPTFFSTRDSSRDASPESRSALRTAPAVTLAGFSETQKSKEKLHPPKPLSHPCSGAPTHLNTLPPLKVSREKRNPDLELPSRSLERGPHPPPFRPEPLSTTHNWLQKALSFLTTTPKQNKYLHGGSQPCRQMCWEEALRGSSPHPVLNPLSAGASSHLDWGEERHVEPLSEGKREGKKLERGTAGCWDGGEGILFNFILSPCLSALQAQLFNIYTQEEERMRKNREGGGQQGLPELKGHRGRSLLKPWAWVPSTIPVHSLLSSGLEGRRRTLGPSCPFVNEIL